MEATVNIAVETTNSYLVTNRNYCKASGYPFGDLYFFVTEVTPVASGLVKLTLKLDVFATYKFDKLTLRKSDCYVQRGTLLTTRIGSDGFNYGFDIYSYFYNADKSVSNYTDAVMSDIKIKPLTPALKKSTLDGMSADSTPTQVQE